MPSKFAVLSPEPWQIRFLWITLLFELTWEFAADVVVNAPGGAPNPGYYLPAFFALANGSQEKS
jgi:hypothetical protein